LATQTCWSSITKCWNEYYLYALSHQFYQLTLQLIRRYLNWCQEQFETHFNGIPVLDYCFVVHDLQTFRSKLKLEIRTVLNSNKTTGVLPAQTQDSICNQIENISNDELATFSDSISKFIISNLSQRTQAELQNITSIPRSYRLTNAPIPTNPMDYVKNILVPLTNFSKTYSHILGDELCYQWSKQVLTLLIARYYELGKQILQAERQKDSLLKKKNPRVAGESQGELSDTDKMTLQLGLDVEHFFAELKLFGLSATDLPGTAELSSLTNGS